MAERNRDLQVVEMNQRGNVWRLALQRQMGLERWKVKKDVLKHLAEEKRERQERLTQMFLLAVISGAVGAALSRLFHLH